jgi:hypothetical protein
MSKQPIACTLTGTEQLGRRERWHRLQNAGNAVRIETPTGLRIEFEHSAPVERELRELAELERGCCSFARWHVHRAGTRVALEVDADGDAVDVLHAMFG